MIVQLSGDGPVVVPLKIANCMRAMTKSKLAEAAGVSRRTLMRWLNSPAFCTNLKSYKLKKQQQKLPGKLVKQICEHYVIDID